MDLDPELAALIDPPQTGRGFSHSLDAATSTAMVGGAYEGASRFDREVGLWCPPVQSADMDILPEKAMSDARSKDILRNDAYVQSGQNLHRDNIVGSIFLLNCKPDWRVLKLDESWAEDFQEEVESKFTLAAESPNNWLDASQMNNLTSMVRLAVGVYLVTGEVLASAEWLRNPARPFNTAVQMIEVDRLSTPSGRMEDQFLRGGVARDLYGAPLGYYIRNAHPSDWDAEGVYSWKYVPARKPWGRPQIIHIIEQGQPHQTRGIGEMVSALKELKIAKKFRDVVLMNAVFNATFAATIESELPSEAVYQQLGGGNIGEGVSGYATSYLGAIQEYVGDSKHIQLDGVKVPHLFPGTKLRLSPAGQGGPLGTEFETSLIRYLAANLGVSYEELSRDYSNTNYSSMRAAANNTWKHLVARKRMVADRFASVVFRLWLEEHINKGLIEAMPARMRKQTGWLYEGLNLDALSSCEWIGASRGQIDELKESQAAVLRLKYHLTTYEDEMARLGKDWRKNLVQRERELKEMKARGLPDPNENGNDNMMNASTGAPREKEAKDEKSDGSEDNTDA